MRKPVYLDYNATTPLDPEVIAAMRPFLEEHFGNPSSTHVYGRVMRKAVDKARAQVAALLGAQPDDIVFTSGGTESNNHALKGAAFAHREKGRHIITSAVEHPAVSEVCAWLQGEGYEVTRLPVDGSGLVDPADLKKALSAKTILVSVMHANNEVGTIQPIRELATIARAHGVLMHTDAAQSVGKIPVRMDDLGVDLLSVAGHKLYAPKGVGALYIRRGVKIDKFMHGAGHEGGRRAGTENVLEIVGLGQACEVAGRDLDHNAARMKRTADALWAGLQAAISDVRLNGHPERRLPNTVSVAFRGIRATDLLERLEHEVAASAGSACHSGETTISPVLKAMGTSREWAMGTVRLSTGKFTTDEEVAAALDALVRAVLETRVKKDELS